MTPSTSLAQSPRDNLLATDPGGRVAPAVEAETARLYQQYEPQILRYCRRHLRSREDAEDAVQNTFLRAFGALQRGVEPQLEAAWLYKIAHNVCVSKALSTQRRAQLESPADFQEMEERLAAPESNVDELFELGDVLEDMPERLRTAILLREWQGLSYAEIADKLGTSRSAVETLIFRARRYLAQALDESSAKLRQLIAFGPVAGLVRGLLVQFGAAKVAVGAAVTATALVGGGVAAHDIISRPSKPSSPGPRSTPAPANSSRALSAGQSSGLRGVPAGTSGGTQGPRRGSKVSGAHGSRPVPGGRAETPSAHGAGSGSPSSGGPPSPRPGQGEPGAPGAGSRAQLPSVPSTPGRPSVPKAPKTPPVNTPAAPQPPSTPSVPEPTLPAVPATLPAVPGASAPSLPPAPPTPTLP